MSTIFTQRKIKNLIDAPETINSDWNSPSVSLDDRFGAFSVMLRYENGAAADMKVYLEFSNDNVNFARLLETEGAITDSSGTVLYDVSSSGTQYARISVVVTAGSIDVEEIRYTGGQFS